MDFPFQESQKEMINLDTFSLQELEEFVAKATEDKQAFGLELFPDRPAGYMRAVNCYVKYCQELIEYMHNVQFNRMARAKNNHEKLSKIYSTIPENFRWSEID
jgi:hypothetical protein